MGASGGTSNGGHQSSHSTLGGCSRSHESVAATRAMWVSISALTSSTGSWGGCQIAYSTRLSSEMTKGPFGPPCTRPG